MKYHVKPCLTLCRVITVATAELYLQSEHNANEVCKIEKEVIMKIYVLQLSTLLCSYYLW
jgi:hypothetical protein